MRQLTQMLSGARGPNGEPQALGRYSALMPCAKPILHSLDYRIELVSFRNRIRYG